jgi:hypothetical protein
MTTNNQPSWEKEFDEKFGPSVVCSEMKKIKSFITSLLEAKDREWREMTTNNQPSWENLRDNIMGMIIKNCSGFDTTGTQIICHLDIDRFEKDLSDLIKQENE